MMDTIETGRKVLFAVIVALPFGAGCGSPDEGNLSGIARAIAPMVDSLNGVPTAVLDEYRCDSGIETCPGRRGDIPASRLDASIVAQAFAEARGIPVVRYDVTDLPGCPWREGGTAPGGLRAEFMRPPLIDGDSARVELATGCMDGSAAFEQVHGFVLMLDTGEWKVVRRHLISIS